MIRFWKRLLSFLCVLIVLSVSIQLAWAVASTFTVHAGEETLKPISLAVDDRVLIKFSVVGQTDSTVYFSLVYPNGTVKDFGKVGSVNYAFVSDAEGDYVMRFSNTGSAEDKLVSLNYEAEHYVFGMPQMLFLTIIIALICIAAVAVFILTGKPH